ncbi:MAG: Periplasmic zinc-binding protein TroA [Alphaproteobacteria bacterium MarineAlpha11_Bin1]|nr:MAG: Periplasmic zinc-binding protein TroA [Alphaproteobacteria bacterium MarineAlpha11_Bin1]|tara:strand:+ start:24557 stop:25534 length:978 start_codon:yes stop_codon:yes gene_type:complete
MSTLTKFANIFAATLATFATLLTVNNAQAEAQKNIVATITQIGEPLSVIAGGRAKIVTLMGEGVDPHLYRLTRSDVLKLNRADLIVYNGLDLEAQIVKLLTKFAAHKPVIGLAEVLRERGFLTKDGRAYDPHVWMDPVLWGTALQTAVDALARIDPKNAEFYHTNNAAYLIELGKLHSSAKRSIASIPNESGVLVTAHDAFGYFARAYGLEVLAVQGISTESEAGVKKIEDLVKTIVKRRVGAVFIESTVSARNVQALIEGAAARGHRVRIGGKLFSDAMGPTGTYVGTYIGMFNHNVTTIVRSLSGVSPKPQPRDQLAETKFSK